MAGAGVAGTPNPAASLLAVVGDCASATTGAAFPGVTSVAMNEITTVAAAYALAGFATDSLHIGAPSAVKGHALSRTGLANAFTIALNLANQVSGVPNATLPLNSNAVVPVTTINTLADILAACINSNGVSSSGCSTLFANTTYGTAPTDTATAAINIAQHPGANVSALLNLATNASPFQPITSVNDFFLGINYTGGGLNNPQGIAIDGAGNAWVAESSGNSVIEFSSAGKVLSGAAGYTGGGLNGPLAISIDSSNNVWVANSSAASVTKFSSSGAVLSGTSGYTGGGVRFPQGIAIDGSGNAWVIGYFSDGLDEFSSTGAVLFGSGGLNVPGGIAIDASGNAWIPNGGRNAVTEFSNAGAILSGTGYTGGGLSQPLDVAIDGAGNVWLANNSSDSVTVLSNTGAALSGTGGYTSGGLIFPLWIAVDGSGNVWATNYQGNSVTELIGVGAPVITSIAAGLPVIPTLNGSSKLGTRP
ncbi:NHL repeat-containing protein [Granulicella mallensis]|uniref:NHL repeat containing protein n=1 Tax=Granulicella mallensis (strain ATCC BAA-1857 / DSM 23137 / MP5ACTX8) TaxID=682795 RepID=G8NPZ0_GRAMM|nr:NHL repeat-containing protein [Granulicella mallensis]AEU38324.1 NHL repeat containing protein [Granulicella mallensis MP5ACTX8]